MKFFQKRWVAITICILMIAVSLCIGQAGEQQVPESIELAGSNHALRILMGNPMTVSEIAGTIFFTMLLILLSLAAIMSAVLRVGKRLVNRLFHQSKSPIKSTDRK